MGQVMLEISPLLVRATIGAALLLCAFGRNTGVSSYSADCATQTDPSYEKHALPHTTLRSDQLGRGLIHHHVRIMTERGCKFIATAE